jgi:hypothetical protein
MQVSKISPYSLNKTFDSFYYELQSHRWDLVTRVLHNEEQVVRCQFRDGTTSPKAYIKYWNMDGTPAAQFTVGSGGVPYYNVLDMCWKRDEQKFLYVAMASGSASYSVYRCNSDGSESQYAIRNFNPPQYAAWATSSGIGYVQIAASDENVYIKTGPRLYRIPDTLLDGSDWSVISPSAEYSDTCFHMGDGSWCRDMMFQPAASGTSVSGHLLYTWYDSSIDTLYLRSIEGGPGIAYSANRWTMLDLSDYSRIQYPVFLNGLDRHGLHVLTVTGSITGLVVSGTSSLFKVFNVDERLAAFMNVNSSDVVMPAGTSMHSQVIATVTNCWGTTLSGKLVQFWISSGDGGVTETFVYTGADGKAQTDFITGANVGTSAITVAVNEI